MTREELIQLGLQYIKIYGKNPHSKQWKKKLHGCSTTVIYKEFGSWISFVEEVTNKPYKYHGTGKLTSITKQEIKNCLACGNEFTSYKKDAKYCSLPCAYTSPLLGGYREGSGRSKTGYCDGIYCGSTYELAWVIYNLDNNIEFSRNTNKFLLPNGSYYYPDFILDNTFIEIKGFHTESVDIKTKAVLDSGNNIKVLYEKDLQYCFDWIKNNYVTPLETLFDDYKPSYNYICDYCNKEFYSEVKKKTDTVYCSRTCSGHGVKLLK